MHQLLIGLYQKDQQRNQRNLPAANVAGAVDEEPLD